MITYPSFHVLLATLLLAGAVDADAPTPAPRVLSMEVTATFAFPPSELSMSDSASIEHCLISTFICAGYEMQASSVEIVGTSIETKLARSGNDIHPLPDRPGQLRGADQRQLGHVEHAMSFATTILHHYQKSSQGRWPPKDTMVERAPTAANNVGELNILSDLAHGHWSWEENFCNCLDPSYNCAIQITRIVERNE